MPFRIILFLSAFFLVMACSKEPGSPDTPPVPPPPLMKMQIGDTASLLLPGSTRQLTVLFPSGSVSSEGATWTSSDPSVVQVNGLGTITGMKAGKAFVIASHPRNQVLSDSMVVYVLADQQIHLVGTASTDRWRHIAFYWKNGVPTQLAGTLNEVGAQASAVTRYQGDVYISGTTINKGFWDMATYWKNGVPVVVSDPANEFNYFVQDILVNAEGVHIAGYDYRDYGCSPDCYPGTKGHYWKANGGSVTEVPIHNSTNDSIATSLYAIAQQGNDIILGGNEVAYRYWGVASTWRNDYTHMDSLTHLSWGMVQDIAVTANGLVAGGFDGCPWTTCYRRATIWDRRNNRTIYLTDGTRDAEVLGLAMDGDKIVAGGYERNASGEPQAACWVIEGSQVRRLPLETSAVRSMIRAVAVKDGEYFLAGHGNHQETGNRVATLWRVYRDMSIMLPQYAPSPWWGSSEIFGILVE
jgi:hypothetical protein